MSLNCYSKRTSVRYPFIIHLHPHLNFSPGQLVKEYIFLRIRDSHFRFCICIYIQSSCTTATNLSFTLVIDRIRTRINHKQIQIIRATPLQIYSQRKPLSPRNTVSRGGSANESGGAGTVSRCVTVESGKTGTPVGR